MSISRVTIEDGCTACGLCVEICPEVFELPNDTAIVKAGADLAGNEAKIREAAQSCPVEVIKVS